MKGLNTVYDPKEFRSVGCQECGRTCSNYPAYKRHMWDKHGDQVLNGDASIKPAPWKVLPMIQGVSGEY